MFHTPSVRSNKTYSSHKLFSYNGNGRVLNHRHHLLEPKKHFYFTLSTNRTQKPVSSRLSQDSFSLLNSIPSINHNKRFIYNENNKINNTTFNLISSRHNHSSSNHFLFNSTTSYLTEKCNSKHNFNIKRKYSTEDNEKTNLSHENMKTKEGFMNAQERMIRQERQRIEEAGFLTSIWELTKSVITFFPMLGLAYWEQKYNLPRKLRNMTSQIKEKDREEYALALAIETLNKNAMIQEKMGMVIPTDEEEKTEVKIILEQISSQRDLEMFTPEGADFDEHPPIKQGIEVKLPLYVFKQSRGIAALPELGACHFVALKVRDQQQPYKLCYELHSMHVAEPSGNSFSVITPSKHYHNMKTAGYNTEQRKVKVSDVLDVTNYKT